MQILKSIIVDDCVDIRTNDNPRYPNSDIYIFHKAVELDVYGENKTVVLYVKEYITDEDNMEMVIVISFHEEGVYDL